MVVKYDKNHGCNRRGGLLAKNFGSADILSPLALAFGWLVRLIKLPISIWCFNFAFIVWISQFCFYGIDFSDEGFYLNWIANPSEYTISYTQFGFLYAPLFELLNRDLVLLRIANLCISYLVSCFLISSVMRKLLHMPSSTETNALAGFLSIPVFLYYSFDFILTPSYNSATFQLMILTLFLLLNFDQGAYKKSFKGIVIQHINCVALGLAGLALALVKPTAGAVLAIFCLFYLAKNGLIYRQLVFLVLLTVFSGLAAVALLIDSSINSFYDRLSGGLAVLVTRDAGYSWQDLIRKILPNKSFVILAATISLPTAIVSFFLSPRLRATLETNSIFWAAGVFMILIAGRHYAVENSIFLIPGFVAGVWIAGFKQKIFVGAYLRKLVAFTVLLLFGPLIYSFGTNGNLFWNAQPAIFFLVIIGMIGMIKHFDGHAKKEVIFLNFGVIMVALTYFLVDESAKSPYRQNVPLLEMESQINSVSANLLVQKSSADYFSSFEKLAAINGFQPEDRVLDLSGRVPAVAFLLGGKNLGTPWMNGAYRGSIASAKLALSYVDCLDLHSAWLITEPNGQRELPLSAFSDLNIFKEDYVLLGSVHVPAGISGAAKSGLQNFYKPSELKRSKYCLDVKRSK